MVLQSLKIGNVLLFKNFKSRRKESLETLQILDMFIIALLKNLSLVTLTAKTNKRGLHVSYFFFLGLSQILNVKVVYGCNLYYC